jgi:hypothetical protein
MTCQSRIQHKHNINDCKPSRWVSHRGNRRTVVTGNIGYRKTEPSAATTELEEWYVKAHAATSLESRARFDRLVSEWKESATAHSLEFKIAMHPAYQRMIGMGTEALPFIFENLKSEKEPGHWFWALASITEANPVPKESRGRLSKMAAAWLKWGSENDYVSLD